MTGVKLPDLGVTRVFWVTTIAAWPAITAAEVNAGVEISKSLLPDYKFGATATNTIKERDITALFDAETPTIKTYGGSLHLFRKLLGTGLAGTDDLLTTFTGLPHGYLVRRTGPLATQAIATGDVVDAGEFIADEPEQESGTGSGFLKIMVPLLAQGYYYNRIVLG
jgi:hypothetical protein